MERRKTLKDIAKKLNMSISTVSKALNNEVDISNLTKERVQKQAKDWNYIPNESARHFKLNKNFIIGVIIPDLRDQFYVVAINGIEEIAAREKYNIIITQSHEDIEKEASIANTMIRNTVDGLLISPTKHTVDMAFLRQFEMVGIPVVCMVREPQDHSFSCVVVNNKLGAFKATEYLIKKGHSRIAHLMGPRTLKISEMRFEGYKEALEMNGIPLDTHLVKTVDFTKRQTEKVVRDLMELEDPPTAMFTFKNYITLDAIVFLKKNYPEKLDSIDFTDFGNLPLFDYLDHKPIASVEEDFYEVGKRAAQLLFQMISIEKNIAENYSQKIEIPCNLVVNG